MKPTDEDWTTAMEPQVLKRARQQLAWRLAAFTTGLICIFALQTTNQIRENTRSEQDRHLRLLALVAAKRFTGLKGNLGPSERSMPAQMNLGGEMSGTRDEDIRILWIGPSMDIVDELGSFVPGGNLVPPPQQRLEPQAISLSNGVGFWLPVPSSDRSSDTQLMRGYVAIASAQVTASHAAAIGLISATAASIVLALLGIPWILERSLLPMREQISRLRHFAADVAHELRNPMMALKTTLANTKGLLRQDPRDSVQNSLQSLDVIASRMATILDDILLLAEIENQAQTARGAAICVDIEDIFDELSVLHDAEARARHIELIFTVGQPFQITVIPSRIQRIISNLITNAIRFSADGAKVHVAAFLQGQQAVIHVDDEGPGIPSSDHDRIFQRFVQLDADRGSVHSGIGLALSRSLAQLHSGSLDVQDSPDGGCRMLLKLPLQSRARPWSLGRDEAST
jgi:signal transduction histidine kinase